MVLEHVNNNQTIQMVCDVFTQEVIDAYFQLIKDGDRIQIVTPLTPGEIRSTEITLEDFKERALVHLGHKKVNLFCARNVKL